MSNINDVFSGLDEIFSKVKENGSVEEVLAKTRVYAKKSQAAIEISRKRIELLDAKTKLSKAFEKYGKLCFSAYEGEEIDAEESEKIAQEILMLKSQCEFLEEEIEAFKEAVANDVEAKMSAKKGEDVVVDDVEVVEVDD